jgi:hypothetical protein
VWVRTHFIFFSPLSIPHTSLAWPWRPGRPLRLTGAGLLLLLPRLTNGLAVAPSSGLHLLWPVAPPRRRPLLPCRAPPPPHQTAPAPAAPAPNQLLPTRVIHASLLCRRVRRCPSSCCSPHGLLYGGAARERHSCRPAVAPLLRPPRLAGVLAATPYHADLSRRRRLVPRRFPALLLWRQCVSSPSATGGTNSGHSHDRAGRSGSHTAYGSSGGTSFAPRRRRSHVQPPLVAAAVVAAVLPQLATAEASREPRMPLASRISRRPCSWSPGRRPLHPAQGEKIECGARSALGRALARAATSSVVSSSLLRVLL